MVIVCLVFENEIKKSSRDPTITVLTKIFRKPEKATPTYFHRKMMFIVMFIGLRNIFFCKNSDIKQEQRRLFCASRVMQEQIGCMPSTDISRFLVGMVILIHLNPVHFVVS